MNSDKQGRAMCACGSSGAAPGAEPAAIAAADLTGTGFLRLRSFAASNAQPVPDVIVTISQRSGTGIPDKTVTTGPEALSDDVAIACPPRSYSLDENNRTVLPYAVVDVTAEHEGYDPVHVAGVQVFDGEVSLLELLMIPVEEDETAAYTVRSLPEDFDIPTHKLFEGGESSGPTPLSACRPRILDQPIIPEKITVHLGRPSANVQNVTVSTSCTRSPSIFSGACTMIFSTNSLIMGVVSSEKSVYFFASSRNCLARSVSSAKADICVSISETDAVSAFCSFS